MFAGLIKLHLMFKSAQCQTSHCWHPPQLFDFDREVQPLLEVLVGKTIEQSLEEVMEEEELACLRAQQRAFEVLRNNELAEVQRLQEKERRHREEKVCQLSKHMLFVSFHHLFCLNPEKNHMGVHLNF